MNEQGYMPNLPIDQQNAEQRKVIKFWIDHCSNLETDRDKWKRMFLKMYEDNAGVTDEMMYAYRAAKNS